MSSSSNRHPRVSVLRAREVTHSTVTPADLGTVRSPAARDLVVDKRLVDDALADGFRAGYEAGFQTGLDEAARAAVDRERARSMQLQTVVAQLSAVADELRHREGTAIAQVEDQVAKAALQIAEVLVGHELAHAPAAGRDAIARALQLAPHDGFVTAYLHPDDAETLGDLESVVPGRTLAVVRDPSLTPGDCVVEVAGCRIDARIEAALARIRDLLGVSAA